jgi:hypothetical protein
MDGSGVRGVNFEQEIREFNQAALNLSKLVVASGDRLAIEALGLSQQDCEFLSNVTTTDLRAIASVDKSLFGLRYGPGAMKNVLRTAGRGDQSLTHSVLACSTPRIADQSALV